MMIPIFLMRIQNFISIGQLKSWEFPIYVDNLLPKLKKSTFSDTKFLNIEVTITLSKIGLGSSFF